MQHDCYFPFLDSASGLCARLTSVCKVLSDWGTWMGRPWRTRGADREPLASCMTANTTTPAFLSNTKLICGGPDSHHCVRRHLHKLVYTTILMIIGVWSPVSAKEKNISSIQIDMSAKALASPIIGRRGHPRKAEWRHLMRHKNLLCSFTLVLPDTQSGMCQTEMWHPACSVAAAAAYPGPVGLLDGFH